MIGLFGEDWTADERHDFDEQRLNKRVRMH